MIIYLLSVFASAFLMWYTIVVVDREIIPDEISVMSIVAFLFIVLTPVINSLVVFVFGLPLLCSFLSEIKLSVPEKWRSK